MDIRSTKPMLKARSPSTAEALAGVGKVDWTAGACQAKDNGPMATM